MKRLFILIGLYCLVAVAHSQTGYTVSGRVVDKNTKAPLPGASVFAQNTTFGMATETGGNFKLKLPDGGYELIITFTGYETESMRISSAAARETLVIELAPKERSMEEVSVIASNEVKDGWAKYGDFFTENFIGKSEFSAQTVIKNPEVLSFYYSKKKNRLKVLAAQPLLVENNALGYTIKFSIDSFTYEYNSNTAQFVGYPLFEEMLGTANKGAVWQQNRAAAYKGSLLHFMRSLYNRSLDDDGFELQFLVKENNAEKPISVKDAYLALNYSRDDSAHTVEFRPNQPDILVIYSRGKPQQAYFTFDPKAKKDFQASTLTVAKGESIVIEQNGYFFEQTDITTNGYWGFQKVGDMLPYDYKE